MEETILIVDDEVDICEVLEISLTDLGYRVHTAGSGEEALLKLDEVGPSIVLTDIRMPNMDGIELLRRIKQRDPDTEVILITGHGDMDLAVKSLKLEATDFITKPINDELLEVALKRAEERLFSRRKIREYTENLERLVREQSEKLVEAERRLAVSQVLEGLAYATKRMTEDFEGELTYFNELPCLVSIHNREGELVAANDLYKRRLGDTIGCKSWDVYVGKPGKKRNCPVMRTFETGVAQRSKEMIRDHLGKELPVIVHTAPIRSKEGEIELALEICADVTEVTRLQEDLRASEERYQQLFDSVPCYISVHDRDLRLRATNRRFKEDFGEGTGAFCYEVYKHRVSPCPECPVLKTFDEDRSQDFETVVTTKNGEPHNVLIRTAPIRNASGELSHVMEVSTDITQIRRLQDHLTSLGLLLGSISHGIKGLLSGLDAAVYWLDSGLEKKDERRLTKGLSALKVTNRRIRNVVLNLLYYAKERKLKKEEVDVAEFFGDIARAFELKVRGQPVEFISATDGAAGRAQVDPGILGSALMNILENAMEACIEDRNEGVHTIVFRASGDGDRVYFKISDDGTGMDKETRDNLFTLFFSSKGSKGTGLGLFMSGQIVQQHGGSIEVESAPGEGASFTVAIPRGGRGADEF